METKLGREGWRLKPHVVQQIVERLQKEGIRENDLDAAVRAELLDTDINLTCAKCLPDGQSLQQARKLEGFWVLQVSNISDVSESSKSLHAGQGEHRLLRLRLSDGHSTVTAIEYARIPSVSADLPPGTKVILGNPVSVHSGILLLEPKCIRVLGGHVQALYDAWEIDRKYSGLAREEASLRRTKTQDGSGPPPFRALQLGRAARATKGVQAVQNSNDNRNASGSGGPGMPPLKLMTVQPPDSQLVEVAAGQPSVVQSQPYEIEVVSDRTGRGIVSSHQQAPS